MARVLRASPTIARLAVTGNNVGTALVGPVLANALPDATKLVSLRLAACRLDDAQASHSAAIVPYRGKRPRRPEDDVFFDDVDFAQVAAQESGKRKRAREEKKRRSKEQAVERELLSEMTAEQVLAMRGAR